MGWASTSDTQARTSPVLGPGLEWPQMGGLSCPTAPLLPHRAPPSPHCGAGSRWQHQGNALEMAPSPDTWPHSRPRRASVSSPTFKASAIQTAGLKRHVLARMWRRRTRPLCAAARNAEWCSSENNRHFLQE